jgi:hypothetical protein
MKRLLLAAILLVVPATKIEREPIMGREPITIFDNVRHIYIEPLANHDQGDHPFTKDMIIR